jgi:hypothetical protein
MNEATMFEWLLKLQPIGVALVLGFAPALIARCKRRRMTPWYLYGLVCALVAWPAVALPAIHALLVRPYARPERISRQRRRASALALLKEESVRSHPSWITELRGKSPAGMDLRRYAYEHLEPGEALVLFRERAEPSDKPAVSYRHRDVHLGYAPRQHRWIADAIDDGLRLFAIVESVSASRICRRPRGVNGTMTRTGRFGYADCALTDAVAATPSASVPVMRLRRSGRSPVRQFVPALPGDIYFSFLSRSKTIGRR